MKSPLRVAISCVAAICLQACFLDAVDTPEISCVESDPKPCVAVYAQGHSPADGIALQNALDQIAESGGTVALGPDTYKVAASLLVRGTGVSMRGA